MPMNSTNRPLWIMTSGFALVIGTLAFLAWFGFRQAAEIRRQAGALVEEHLAALKLIEELELAHHRASTIMLNVSRPSATRQSGTLGNLDEFEASLSLLIQEGERVLPSPLWVELARAGAGYTATIRQVALHSSSQKLIDKALPLIQEKYDEFVRLADDALKLDALRAAAGGRSIERASSELTSESGSLLAGALILSLACALITIRFTLQSLRRIAWQGRELNRVSWHLIQGQEDAARRFSHELHDELGQALTGLKAMIAAIQPTELSTRRGACLALLDEAIGNVRELSQLLRPIILDDFGLPAALRWLAERFEDRTRIEVETRFSEIDRLADDVETHLYRITQEALTNIARHAGATSARLELVQSGSQIVLTITDNGSGLPRKRSITPSLGVFGMRARAEQLGGRFSLANQPEGGVCVTVSVPARFLQEEPHANV